MTVTFRTVFRKLIHGYIGQSYLKMLSFSVYEIYMLCTQIHVFQTSLLTAFQYFQYVDLRPPVLSFPFIEINEFTFHLKVAVKAENERFLYVFCYHQTCINPHEAPKRVQFKIPIFILRHWIDKIALQLVLTAGYNQILFRIINKIEYIFWFLYFF